MIHLRYWNHGGLYQIGLPLIFKDFKTGVWDSAQLQRNRHSMVNYSFSEIDGIQLYAKTFVKL